jgi:hypothetical protein
MDKTIRKVIDLAEQHAETYRYWRSRSSSECFEATYRHRVESLPAERHRVEWRRINAILCVFNERNVKYLVVGGYAVSYFTEPRVTKDLDIFYRHKRREGSNCVRRTCSIPAGQPSRQLQQAS